MEHPLVIQDPDILSGIPVFYGTRVPVKNLLDYLAAGDTLEEFLDDFPSVKREIAMAFLEQSNYLYDKSFAPRHSDTI